MDEEKKIQEAMLSTIDNPYNPCTNFDEWYAWDQMAAIKENRATCCCYLDRMSSVSDEVGENEYNQIMNDIIDDIVELNLNGKFIKVTKEI